MYISSVMRFILFDSVLAKECRIRQGWSRRQGPGWRYFLWKLLYTLATFGVIIVVVGIPAGFAFAMGWLNQPSQHVVPLVLGGIVIFFVFAILILAMAVIYVLTKDFVVPQMALENIGAIEGWRRLWAMMKAEKGGYAGYLGMKIVLAIGASIVLGIVGFILALIILIPASGVAVAAVVGGKAAGLGWTVGTITLAVVAGCALLAVFLFMWSLISVPEIVFFPAYSIYFFAARYPALSAVLYSAAPAPPARLRFRQPCPLRRMSLRRCHLRPSRSDRRALKLEFDCPRLFSLRRHRRFAARLESPSSVVRGSLRELSAALRCLMLQQTRACLRGESYVVLNGRRSCARSRD